MAIPWDIRDEHKDRYLVVMLRAHARRQNGLALEPPLERMLESFLRSVEEDDFVVDYDPDTDEGFFRVQRRPGIDTGLIREPEGDDETPPLNSVRGVEWGRRR